MAKKSLAQKRAELERIAKDIEQLENEVATKIGKWVVRNTEFDSLNDFRKYYETVVKFYEENHKSDNIEDVRNEPNENGNHPF
ncbi:TPA: hypothetical protein U0597_002127 [Streptococcus suis]|nr:hypothetical protein [Streptococcus suis]